MGQYSDGIKRIGRYSDPAKFSIFLEFKTWGKVGMRKILHFYKMTARFTILLLGEEKYHICKIGKEGTSVKEEKN